MGMLGGEGKELGFEKVLRPALWWWVWFFCWGCCLVFVLAFGDHMDGRIFDLG